MDLSIFKFFRKKVETQEKPGQRRYNNIKSKAEKLSKQLESLIKDLTKVKKPV